jgi:hypothetical protein
MTKIKQSGNYTNFLLFLMCFFILFLLFRWVHFLLNKNYLHPGTYLESYTSLGNTYDTNTDPETNTDTDPNIVVNNSYKVNYIHSNTIDLPALSKYTCGNWCGPKSQCLLSREQCFSDVDCKGCQDLTALNNFYDNPATDLGQSYMNSSNSNSEEDIPKSANEYILCGDDINSCNNNFARFDRPN